MTDPRTVFHSDGYLADNKARLDHMRHLLRDIGFDPKSKNVLEIGAGIGDHTEFWRNLGANVTVTDARADNIAAVKKRFIDQYAFVLDLDHPDENVVDPHPVVYAYGVLEHLSNPGDALAYLASKCTDLLFIETRVSYGDQPEISFHEEPSDNPSQAISGRGCRPTRAWVFDKLKEHFPCVYQPSYQPVHDQFPTEWESKSAKPSHRVRTTFVASRRPLRAGSLFPYVLQRQTRRKVRAKSVKAGLESLLEHTSFELVIDVGANQGQFAKRMRALGHNGRIASFEPLRSAFDRLAAVTGDNDQHRAFPFALGAVDETRDLNVSGNSASTSLLPLTSMTTNAEPMTAVVGTEIVQVRRLDDLADEVFGTGVAGNVLLKLDVQGTELDVLEGATESLSRVTHVLSECSLVPVYEGEPLIEDQVAWMRKEGFHPISLDLGWSDQATGETYQVDILFTRDRGSLTN
ncbi:MAG: FkbM family methyltransferase [Pseudomonadota bacterium]